MAELAKLPGAGASLQAGARLAETARCARAVETVERLVLEALPERLSEAFLAAAANLDIDELIRAFVVARDETLQAGLRNMRLDELKRRLDADPRLSPRVAARDCGFGSFNILQRLFKARFGRLLTEMNATPPASSQKPGSETIKPGQGSMNA